MIDIAAVKDIFLSVSAIRPCTEFLLTALAGDKEEQGALQTQVLEINLRGGAPQVANAILSNKMFSHFDRPYIAKLCEAARLFQRALELFDDVADIKRVIVNTNEIPAEFITEYFRSLTQEDGLECLKELIQRADANPNNRQLVVQIARTYSEEIGPEPLISLFEDFKDLECLFAYLSYIYNGSTNPEVHYKYIETAAKMAQRAAGTPEALNYITQVKQLCLSSEYYDGARVKDFLMDEKLPDPTPLIYVCDRHDFIEDLIGFLHSHNPPLDKFIQVYLEKVSPQRTPRVIGKLLDMDCNEEFIHQLLAAVRHAGPQSGLAFPVSELVDAVDERGRLRMLKSWLEQRVEEGNTETATHNAIGKLYVRMNKEPQQFLTLNQYYDSKVLGPFCEKLDPFLAFVAYKRGAPECDDLLLECCYRHGLFKDLARHLVAREDEGETSLSFVTVGIGL